MLLTDPGRTPAGYVSVDNAGRHYLQRTDDLDHLVQLDPAGDEIRRQERITVRARDRAELQARVARDIEAGRPS